MESKILIKKYRDKLTRLHGLTVSIVAVLEILAYIVFVRRGFCVLSPKSTYLWFYVILPIVINFGAHFVARLIIGKEKFKANTKNAAIVYAAQITSVTVSILHREFIVAACSFVFPMILSAMFNNRKLLTQSLVISLLSLSATIAVLVSEGKANLAASMNYLILYGFVMVAYFSGLVAIDYSELNLFVIENQALTNLRLRSKINKDSMTGLFNHKMFYNELHSAVAESENSKTDFCVAMFDIDDFKLINDTYGHDSGDEVLISLAQTIKKNCGSHDIPFRYGGEEFAIIFKGKTLEEACRVMERILESFRNTKFAFTEDVLTFSCGIARFEPGKTKEEIFDLADDNMYAAKNNGKNQIYCASDVGAVVL